MKNEKIKKDIKTTNNKIRPLIFLISLLIFLITVQHILKDRICVFDDLVYKNISKLINPTLTTITKTFTHIGSAYVMIPICVALLIALKDKLKAKAIIINLIVAGTLNYLLKNIFERPRPEQYKLITETGYSFPSGHSMVSMAFYGFLIYLIFYNIKDKTIKWLLIIFLSILIILIGISRIYLGVHYASDVLGGFVLAVSYLAVFTKVYKEISKRKNN